MRDLPDSRTLLERVRSLLLDEIEALVPPERRRDLHLAATAILLALREGRSDDWQAQVEALLTQFYRDQLPAPTPALPHQWGREPTAAHPSAQRQPSPPRAGEGRGGGTPDVARLMARFAADLRNGEFETSPSQQEAARVILWHLVAGKLREANPQFLAANGYR